MSGSAAIAAAHKRRAQAQPSQDKAFSRYRPSVNAKVDSRDPEEEVEVVAVKDVLRLVFARLSSLKSDMTSNEQHWADHDALVKQICESVDALSRRVDGIEEKLTASKEE